MTYKDHTIREAATKDSRYQHVTRIISTIADATGIIGTATTQAEAQNLIDRIIDAA